MVDEKILKQFEPYDKEKNNWVGSRDYWKSIFSRETNRDTELHKKFCELHTELVNRVIDFCKENNIENADSLNLHINGLSDGTEDGEWTPGIDSNISLQKYHWDKTGDVDIAVRDEDDFLFAF